ncbi:SDR family NAD(P)-dependent oxidoreductase, partial [Hydrogenophaga sp.]|uniref:SDR family NAD(P)-dependent oxidoreductase n=1 Tax=Hydrogenophaga sp. TaxID=1904254 RepID=UPI003AF5DA9E
MSTPHAFVESPAQTAAVATAPRGFSFFKPMNPPITDWRGLRVWLVGASSGIGEATASALHARGAQVLVSARSREALDRFVLNHPPQHGVTAQAWPLDVTDADAVTATTREILAQGPLDLVVYCAGHYRDIRASEMDMADLKRHLDIIYIGAL